MKLGIMSMAVLLNFTAEAGQGGNGGGAFVCRNSAGKIVSAILVDLYEAEAQYDLNVKKDARLTVDEQLDLAAFRIQSISNDFYLQLEPHLTLVREILRPVSNAQLENTKDFDILVSPKTCVGGVIKFEQLANYTDEGQLIVDEEIWKYLPPTDKAALYIHEAVYSYLRKEDKVVTSKRARQITGYTFSAPTKSAFKLLLDTAILSGEYKCEKSDMFNFSIKAELPNIGGSIPVYKLFSGMKNSNGLWLHEASLKEISQGEFQGNVTATITNGSDNTTKYLFDGKSYLRRLSDGKVSAEISWSSPNDNRYVGMRRYMTEDGIREIKNRDYFQSKTNPQWWFTAKFSECVRTGSYKE